MILYIIYTHTCITQFINVSSFAVKKAFFFLQLIGIWFISEWMATGKSPKFQLVELGPGRGSLIDDILRVSKNSLFMYCTK